MIEMLPQLDEVEGYDVRGEAPSEVQGEEYDLPLARALRAIEYDEELAARVWLNDGLEELLPRLGLTEEQKDILRSRDLDALKVSLGEERRAAGVPEDHIIVWALVRV